MKDAADRILAQAANVCAELIGADTVPRCMTLFKAAITPFGFDTYACGEIDLANRARVVFFAVDWPDAWRAFYLSSRLAERDPLLDALADRREPFTWTEFKADGRLAKIGRQALDLAAERGWTEGLVVPIPRSGTRVGLVSLVGGRTGLSAGEVKALVVLSTTFHARVRYLAPRLGFPAPPFGLSARELECLNHVAEGLSDRAIGERLGIAASTAHEHIEGGKRKLKTRSRAHAVAVAMCFGLLKM